MKERLAGPGAAIQMHGNCRGGIPVNVRPRGGEAVGQNIARTAKEIRAQEQSVEKDQAWEVGLPRSRVRIPVCGNHPSNAVPPYIPDLQLVPR